MSDGCIIKGWKRICTEYSTVIIYFHGNGGDRGFPSFRPSLVKDLSILATVYTFDYRGFGDSDGSALQPERISNDLVELIEWIRKCEPEKKLLIVSHSLGCALNISILHSYLIPRLRVEEGCLRGLVFLAPFTSIPETILRYPILRRLPFLPGILASRTAANLQFNNMAMLGANGGLPRSLDILFMHGREDGEIEPIHGYRLFRECIRLQRKNVLYHNESLPDGSIRYLSKLGNLGFVEIANAGHNDIHRNPTALAELAKFFNL